MNNKTIDKYGIQLIPLTEKEIELVRNWRNDPKVSQYMSFRDHITPEMQKKWFAAISNENNYFFIIKYRGKKIGLVNIKDIDWTNRSGEWGMFIYEDRYLNTPLPYQISLAILEFGFYTLELKMIYSHILKTNARAFRFNRSFGFELQPDQEDIENQLYCLSKEKYGIKSMKLREIILISMQATDE